MLGRIGWGNLSQIQVVPALEARILQAQGLVLNTADTHKVPWNPLPHSLKSIRNLKLSDSQKNLPVWTDDA